MYTIRTIEQSEAVNDQLQPGHDVPSLLHVVCACRMTVSLLPNTAQPNKFDLIAITCYDEVPSFVELC